MSMNRCAFCRVDIPLGSTVCPSCGRSVLEGRPANTPPVATLAAHPTPSEMAGTATQPPHAVPQEEGWSDVHVRPPTSPEAASRPAPTPGKPTNDKAIASLALGVAGWIFLPLICTIAAIVLGHMARREIRESGGAEDGAGLAMIGLVLGYVQVVGLLIVVGLIALAIAIGVDTAATA